MHPYSAFSIKDYVFDWQKRKNKNRINLFRSQILENRINFSRAYNCTFTVLGDKNVSTGAKGLTSITGQFDSERDSSATNLKTCIKPAIT